MLTTVYLIRHGEVEAAFRDRFVGSTDAPLSGNGQAQIRSTAGLLARHAGETPLCAVYCSDLARSIASAAIVAEPRGLTPVREPALREMGFGSWENLTFTEILARDPGAFERWMQNAFRDAPPGGEPLEAVRARAVSAYLGIVERHAGASVAIVAHGGVNRIILAHVLGLPGDRIFSIEQSYAALNIIKIHDRHPVVALLNGTQP